MRIPTEQELERQKILFYKLVNGYLAIGWFAAIVYGIIAFAKWLFA